MNKKLAAGQHTADSNEACIMEYVSVLQNEPFSDHPQCVHPVIAAAARSVNDWMTDENRHKLHVLVPLMVGTNTLVVDGQELDQRVGEYAQDHLLTTEVTQDDRLLDYLYFVINLVIEMGS